jgi:hypothetical protein
MGEKVQFLYFPSISFLKVGVSKSCEALIFRKEHETQVFIYIYVYTWYMYVLAQKVRNKEVEGGVSQTVILRPLVVHGCPQDGL